MALPSPACFWARASPLGGLSAVSRRADTRSVLSLGTAQRNIAAALVVANQSFEDPNVVVMVVVVAIVGLLTLMPLSRALGRHAAGNNNANRLRRRPFVPLRQSYQMTIDSVSELCQMRPHTAVKHGNLRGHLR